LVDLAVGRRADRPAEDRQQRDRHLAGREPEQEAGEDHAIDVPGAPGVGADDLERAEGAGARHVQLDHPELGEQPARVSAVAAIGMAELRHALEMAIDQLAPAAFQQLGKRLPRRSTIIPAPFHAFGLDGLQHREGNR